jgi:hypothetical protein
VAPASALARFRLATLQRLRLPVGPGINGRLGAATEGVYCQYIHESRRISPDFSYRN